MASGSFQGSGVYLIAKINWSSSAGTGGSTVSASLIAQNTGGMYAYAHLYQGYSLTIDGSSTSGSGAALSSTPNGAVTVISHSKWVSYTGNKSININGSINATGININGTILGVRTASQNVSLDKVGTAPSKPIVTAPKSSTISESTQTITISWEASSSYSGAGNYIVQVSINSGSWTNVASDIPWSQTTYDYTITNHSLGTSYQFRVAAKNDVGTSEYSVSDVVSINTMSPPTIGEIGVFNPYINTYLSIPLSGGAQSDGSSFKRMADVYVDGILRYKGSTPSYYNNSSVSVYMSASNILDDLGLYSYSSSNRFTVVAWIENSAGTKSNTVSKEFTVNVNSDGGAAPTLSSVYISGGSFNYDSTCFIETISTIAVSSGNAYANRASSGTTLSYKVSCTGYTDKYSSSASFNNLTSGLKNISVTVTDSRGLSTTKTQQIRVQSYLRPTIKNLEIHRMSVPETNATMTYTLSYSPIYSYANGVNSQGTQLNGIYSQQYSKNGTSWSSYTSGQTITGLDTELVYNLQLRVSDKVQPTVYVYGDGSVGSQANGISMRKGRMGINCVPQVGHSFEVKGYSYLDGEVEITSGLSVNGTVSGKIADFDAYSVSYEKDTQDGGVPYAGSALGNQSEIYNMSGYRTYLGSVSVGYKKQSIISVRDKNGYSDGSNSGLLIHTSLESASGDLFWTKQADNSWMETRTIVDSENFSSFLLSTAFYVGCIHITVNNVNPGTYLGGTWVQFAQGRTLIGAGEGDDGTTSMTFTALSQGGEYLHSLTLDEIPSHNHGAVYQNGSDGAQGTGYDSLPFVRAGGQLPGSQYCATHSVGGGQSHNNLSPYIIVYFWRRTA